MSAEQDLVDTLPYEGCARACWPRGKPAKHTLVWGECAHAAPPPCRHPAGRFSWVELKNALECAACRETVGLLDVIEQAQATVLGGCLCPDEGASGHTPQCFKPIGWSLDPEQIRNMIDCVPMVARYRTLLGAFIYGDRDPQREAHDGH